MGIDFSFGPPRLPLVHHGPDWRDADGGIPPEALAALAERVSGWGWDVQPVGDAFHVDTLCEELSFDSNGGWLSKPSSDPQEFDAQWGLVCDICVEMGWVIWDPQVGAVCFGVLTWCDVCGAAVHYTDTECGDQHGAAAVRVELERWQSEPDEPVDPSPAIASAVLAELLRSEVLTLHGPRHELEARLAMLLASLRNRIGSGSSVGPTIGAWLREQPEVDDVFADDGVIDLGIRSAVSLVARRRRSAPNNPHRLLGAGVVDSVMFDIGSAFSMRMQYRRSRSGWGRVQLWPGEGTEAFLALLQKWFDIGPPTSIPAGVRVGFSWETQEIELQSETAQARATFALGARRLDDLATPKRVELSRPDDPESFLALLCGALGRTVADPKGIQECTTESIRLPLQLFAYTVLIDPWKAVLPIVQPLEADTVRLSVPAGPFLEQLAAAFDVPVDTPPATSPVAFRYDPFAGLVVLESAEDVAEVVLEVGYPGAPVCDDGTFPVVLAALEHDDDARRRAFSLIAGHIVARGAL